MSTSYFTSLPRPLAVSLSRFASAAGICAALLMAGTASAATLEWDADGDPLDLANGGTGIWNTTNTFWYNGSTDVAWPNTATDLAVFNGTAGTVSLGAPISANGLQFDVGGYTIDNGGTAGNTLTLSGSAPSVSVTNVGTSATISAIIAGPGWTKLGAGNLTLSGANTFTGLTLAEGSVTAATSAALGAGAINLNGGSLITNQTGQITLGAAQVLNVGAAGGTIDNTVTQKILINIANGLTGSGTLTRNASANNTLANVLQISSQNTGFTGAVVLNGGVTEVGLNGLGTGAAAGNTITINAGGELSANNTTLAHAIFLNGGTIGGNQANSTYSGSITVNGNTNIRLGDFHSATNRSLNFTGNLTGVAGNTLTTINAATATSGSGQTLTLNPTTGDNSGFLGTINITAGHNINFVSANALIGGTVNINTTATQLGGVAFGYDFGGTVPAFTNVRSTATGGVFGLTTTLPSTTSLDLSTLGGGGMLLGSPTSGSYTSTTLGADAGVWRLGGGSGTLTLPNATLTGANNLAVGDSRANGNGTVVLAGANTFTGQVTVNNGVVSVSSINSVSGGTASSNLGVPTTVTDGTINLGSTTAGALRYTGSGETTDRVINLAGTTGGGILDNQGTGLLKFTSDLTMSGAGAKALTLQGATHSPGEFSGKIINSSVTVAKAGTNTWLLSGAGNSVQQLTLAGGVLDIGVGGIAVANGSGNIIQASANSTINATGGGILTIGSGTTTDGGNIGAANGTVLTINANMTTATPGTALEIFNAANSTGVVVLNGTNTFSGNTFINSGVLQVSGIASALGTGATINIGSGGNTTNTLRYTGAGETTAKTINLNATTGAAAIEQAGTGLLQFSSNFTATGVGSKTLTLLGSTAGTGEIVGNIIDNSGTNKTSLTKTGTGTWTLSGANTYTGATTVANGTLTINGETGSLSTSSAINVATGGTLNYQGKSTGSTQTLGATSITSGQATISSTYGTSGNTNLTLTSLARTAGASVNFVTSGGTNGTTNLIAITGQATSGFINQGTFFSGADFAYYNGTGVTGFLRAPVYGAGGDANFTVSTGGGTIGTNNASTHVRLDVNVTAQTNASVATLKLNGARTLAINGGQTLTVASGGLLATGGASTISGGTITSGTAEMNIRANAASDALTISSVLGGSGGLVKSGAGTLTLSNLTNTFTGNIFVNAGTLAYAGTNNSADPVALGAGAKTITLTNGSVLRPTITSNPTANTKSFVVGVGGATFDVPTGVTFQLDDANQFSGTGDLTVTSAGTGTVFLNNQTFTFTGNVFVNSGTLRLGANGGVLGTGTGRTITVGSGGVVDAQTTLPLGLVLNGTGNGSAGALVNTSTTAAGGFSGPVTINTGATIGGAGSLNLSGIVSGSGLTKVGANNLTLSGNNNYGTTTINSGGVIFNSTAAFGGAGASVVNAAGTTAAAGYAIDQDFLTRLSSTTTAFNVGLAANSANPLDFNAAGLTNASLGATGAFTYTGTLTPNGSTYRFGGGGGTLTLSNTNTLTGANALVVSGNTVLPASNDYTGTTTVNSGILTLGATSSSSAFTIAAAGTLQLGQGGTTGSLGTATLVNNGTLAYNHSDNVVTDAFTGTGSISQVAASTLTINPATTSMNRLFISAAGGTIDLGSVDRSVGIDGGNSIQMNAAGIGTINASGNAKLTFALAGTDIGAAAGGTLVINPVIQGTNGFDIFNNGSGTVVLNGANTYTGGTSVQNGVLSVASLNSVDVATRQVSSNMGAPTTIATGTINIGNGTSAGTLRYTGAGETTDRVINLASVTGGVTLDQTGTGLLKFTSNFTATGAGIKTLTLQGSTAGAGEIAGAIVDNSGTNRTALTKAGTGTWTLSGANTYTGATAVNGGTLNLTGNLGATAIAVGNAGRFTQSAGSVISGAASFTSNGNSTLSGINTFTGAVTVNAGPLTITNSSALGSGTKTITVVPTTNPTSNPSLRLDGSAGDITLPASMSFSTSFDALNPGPMPNSAAIVNVAGNNTIQGNFTLTSGGGGTALLSNAGSLAITGSITPNTAGRSLYLRGDGDGVISGNMVNGSGNWFVNKDVGTGKWTLAGTNTYNGITTVGNGTLQFARQVSLYNNTPGSWTSSNIIVKSGATLALNVGGAGEFTAANLDALKALGTATDGFLNGSAIGLDTTNAAGGSFTYASVIANTNGGANSIDLVKLGTSSLILSAASTYTGATNVDEGTLVIDVGGSISASSAINIAGGAVFDVAAFIISGGFNLGPLQTVTNNGTITGDVLLAGMLNGTGSVEGAIEALAGSTISPGNSAGTLTVTTDFSLDAGATLSLELGTVAVSDKVSVATGVVTLGGILDITFLPTYAGNIGDAFTAILNSGSGGVSGFFSNVTPINATTGTLTLGDGHVFLVDYAGNADGGITPNDIILTTVAVPEPSAAIALVGGMGMLLGMRRRRRVA